MLPRHAYETGCGDCFDYSNSVGYALPYLQAAGLDTCKVHKVGAALLSSDDSRHVISIQNIVKHVCESV